MAPQHLIAYAIIAVGIASLVTWRLLYRRKKRRTPRHERIDIL